MKAFCAVLLILSCATRLQATEYEFAFLSFASPASSFRWTDRTGAHEMKYTDLIGRDADRENPAASQILALNALSKKGWEIVHVTDVPTERYLLKRETSGGPATQPVSVDGATKIDATFTGGYETDPRDHGRPVVLIAAGLKVPSDVFRKAFSNVKPAGPGQEPEPAQVRKNKQELMQALEPYGVTDDTLNTVSNFYRYSSSRGQMWKHTPAAAYAMVRNGKVVSFTITDPGAGYSSAPTVSVPGIDDPGATVVLSFGTDLSRNGSVKEIALGTQSPK